MSGLTSSLGSDEKLKILCRHFFTKKHAEINFFEKKIIEMREKKHFEHENVI